MIDFDKHTRHGSTLWLPKKQPVGRYVQKMADADLLSWRKYTVENVGFYATHLGARTVRNGITQDSNYETEKELGRGRRKKRATVPYSPESRDSDSGSEIAYKTKKSKIAMPPPVPFLVDGDISIEKNTTEKKINIITSGKPNKNVSEKVENPRKLRPSASEIKAKLEKAKEIVSERTKSLPVESVKDKFEKLRRALATKRNRKTPCKPKHQSRSAAAANSNRLKEEAVDEPDDMQEVQKLPTKSTSPWKVNPITTVDKAATSSVSPGVSRVLVFNDDRTLKSGKTDVLAVHCKTCLLLADLSAFLPQTDLSAFLPQTDLLAFLPRSDLSAFLPQTDLSAFLPRSDLSAFLPQTDLSAFLPQTDLSASLPQADPEACHQGPKAPVVISPTMMDIILKAASHIMSLLEKNIALGRSRAAAVQVLSSKVDVCCMNQARLNKALLPEEKRIKRPADLPAFPLKTLEDFAMMETFLNNDLNLTATVDYLEERISVKNSEKKNTGALLRIVISNRLACNFNFDGSGGSKKGLAKSKIWELVQGCLLRKFPDSDLLEATKETRCWLRNAPWRKLDDGFYGKRAEGKETVGGDQEKNPDDDF